jgi:hypothetical protein
VGGGTRHPDLGAEVGVRPPPIALEDVQDPRVIRTDPFGFGHLVPIHEADHSTINDL